MKKKRRIYLRIKLIIKLSQFYKESLSIQFERLSLLIRYFKPFTIYKFEALNLTIILQFKNGLMLSVFDTLADQLTFKI